MSADLLLCGYRLTPELRLVHTRLTHPSPLRSSGSCCIDSLSALHIGADFLIHYGHACLTPCADPALAGRIRYVFPRLPLAVPACAQAIADLAKASSAAEGDEPKRGVLVVHEVGYEHAAAELERVVRQLVKGKGREVLFSHIRLDEQDGADEVDGAAAALGKLDVAGAGEARCQTAPSDRLAADQPSPSQGSCCGDPASSLGPPSSVCCQPASSPLDPPSSSCCSPSTTAAPSACCSTRVARPDPPVGQTSTTSTSLRSYALPPGAKLEDIVVFFIGREESLQLRNLLVTHSRNTVRPPFPLARLPQTQQALTPLLARVPARSTRTRPPRTQRRSPRSPSRLSSSRRGPTGCSCAGTPSCSRPATPTSSACSSATSTSVRFAPFSRAPGDGG